MTANNTSIFEEAKLECNPAVADMILYQVNHKDWKGKPQVRLPLVPCRSRDLNLRKLQLTGGIYGVNNLIKAIQTSARESHFGKEEWDKLREAVDKGYANAANRRFVEERHVFRFRDGQDKELGWLDNLDDSG